MIDGAEFNNPSSDRVLGFPDVAKNYMIQSYHQNTETFEVLLNKGKYDALPAELKAVIRHAAEAASADMSWKQQLRYPNDLLEMAQRQGVNVQVTPRPVLDAQLRAWDGVIRNLESADPFFKKVTRQPARMVPPRQRLLPALPGEPGAGLQPLLRARLNRAADRGARPGRTGAGVRATRGTSGMRGCNPSCSASTGSAPSSARPSPGASSLLTGVVVYEIVMRYAFRAPTSWAYDVSYMLYGTLFMMAGAYALSRNGHVRGDFLYRNFAPGDAGAARPGAVRAVLLPGDLRLHDLGLVLRLTSRSCRTNAACSARPAR